MAKKTVSIKKQRTIRMTLTYLLLLIVCTLIIYPLVWTIGASFNPGNSLVSTSIIPDNPTVGHYKDLFQQEGTLYYGKWYMNSMKISILTMVFSILCVSYTAYAFSRFRFKGRKKWFNAILAITNDSTVFCFNRNLCFGANAWINQ